MLNSSWDSTKCVQFQTGLFKATQPYIKGTISPQLETHLKYSSSSWNIHKKVKSKSSCFEKYTTNIPRIMNKSYERQLRYKSYKRRIKKKNRLYPH